MRMMIASVLLLVAELVVSLTSRLLEASELAGSELRPHDQLLLPVVLEAMEEEGLDPALALNGPLHLPYLLVKAIAKAKVWMLSVALVVLVGGALTMALCTLTPFCKLKLPEVLGSSTARMSADQLAALTTLVSEATAKYSTLQKQQSPRQRELPQTHS